MCQKLLQAIAWTAWNDATNQHTLQEFLSMSCNVTQPELVAPVKIMPRSKTAKSFSLVWVKLANQEEATCTSPVKLPEKFEGLGTGLKTSTDVWLSGVRRSMELLSSLFGSRSIRNQKVDNENMSCIMSEVNSPMQLNQETPERLAMVACI